jgi:hypothetical protein
LFGTFLGPPPHEGVTRLSNFFAFLEGIRIVALRLATDFRLGSSAVEQVTLNHLVQGSNPCRATPLKTEII